MNFKRLNIIIAIFLSISSQLYCQEVSVYAGCDSNTLLIGDQFKVFFEAVQGQNYEVNMPVFKDSIINKIEIIEAKKPDTTYISNNVFKVRQEYTVTSFDTGFYLFRAFPFVVKNKFSGTVDTIYSQPFYANFFSIPIDTTKGIFDVKKPLEAPLIFKEVFPYIIYSMLAVLAILAVIYIIRKRKKNEPVFSRPKPKIPPHVIALDELEKLKSEKLWQQGLLKEYYSRLTDIIRIYFENRFNFPAMEQISDEIVESFGKIWKNDQELIDELKELLETADYVKFAKMQPLPDENENMFKIAWKIIKTTIPVVEINTAENNEAALAEKTIENAENIINEKTEEK
jgi:hypothetical protein